MTDANISVARKFADRYANDLENYREKDESLKTQRVNVNEIYNSTLRQAKIAEDYIESNLLSGEKKLLSLRDAFIHHLDSRQIPGILYMTSFRIIFVPDARELEILSSTNSCIYSWLDIPLSCIEKIDKERKTNIRCNSFTVTLTCKDVRMYRITFLCKPSTVISSPSDPLAHSETDIERAVHVMATYAFPVNAKFENANLLFAFDHEQAITSNTNLLSYPSIESYDPVIEFNRQGIMDFPSTFWRLSIANAEYKLCDSYPKILIVPKQFSDEDLFGVAAFRSGGRLPTLCWGERITGASIWRSSQPKTGMSGSCLLDERYLDAISQVSTAYPKPILNPISTFL